MYNKITGQDCEFESLFELERFPIHMLEDDETQSSNDKFHSLNIGIDPSSGVVQVLQVPSKEELYIDTHSNAVGGVWAGHHKMAADIIRKFNPKNVLEIGGATGVLESIYNMGTSKTLSWTILEPEPHPIKGTNATFIKGFFPDDLPGDIEFDCFVHTHTLEHMNSVYDFVKGVSEKLENKKKMVFSIPNFEYLTDSMATSILNFEHTIYLTENYVDWLLSIFNFKVLSKEYYINHSIIYSVEKSILNNKIALDGSLLYKKNKEAFEKYYRIHKSRISHLNSLMNTYKYPIVFFGAHIAMQYYIAFGLDTKKMSFVIDNDSYKHKKRVGGTDLKVFSPSKLKEFEQCAVILPQSPYADEIRNQILTEINLNVVFWE